MEKDKLEEILLLISYKDEDKDRAEQAFNTLYKEFSKFLYSVVRRQLYNMGIHDDQYLEAVVSNTFITIFENPLKFSIPVNYDQQSGLSFKAWISRIARNELYDLLRDFQIVDVNTIGNVIEPAFSDMFIDNESIDYESINQKILNEALDTISERNKEILLTLYLFHEKGKNTPSEVLNNLCTFFGTTKDNIRQIKVRSEKKIIEHFSKYSQLRPQKDAKR